MLINIKPEIKRLLRGIPELGNRVYLAYPEDGTEFPCATFYEAANSAADRRDDQEYITEIEVYVSVWGETPEQIEPIARQVEERLTAARYQRMLCYDDYSGTAKQKIMRYRAYKAHN